MGKIYCAYNGYDYALTTSKGANLVTRMGAVGVGTYDLLPYGAASWWVEDEEILHPDIRGHTENFNAGAKIDWGNTTAHFQVYYRQVLIF